MIEFPPNPSGPAHIGTLRSYTRAWIEAKKNNETIYVRFDTAVGLGDVGARQTLWSQAFLSELEELDMVPDHWQYFDEEMFINALPSWAVVRETQLGPWAFFPEPFEPLTLPSEEASLWCTGGDVPYVRHDGSFKWCWGYGFRREWARWNEERNAWRISDPLCALIHMNLRGVRTIIRSHLGTLIRPYCEEGADKWFGLCLPNVVYTSVVTTEHHALRKSLLQPGDPGTIRWAIDTYGAAKARDLMLYSLQTDDRPIIPLEDIFDAVEAQNLGTATSLNSRLVRGQ